MIVLASLAAAALLQEPPSASDSLWQDIRQGHARPWHSRSVSLSGYVDARRLRDAVLAPVPPSGSSAVWDQFDPHSCVGLLISPAQLRVLRDSRRVTVSGRFLAIQLGSTGNNGPVSMGARIAYPHCASVGFVAPFIYVETVTSTP